MFRVKCTIAYLIAPMEFEDVALLIAAMIVIDDEIRDIEDRYALLESAINEIGILGSLEASPRSEILVEKANSLENCPRHGKITTMHEAARVPASIVDFPPALGFNGERQITGIA